LVNDGNRVTPANGNGGRFVPGPERGVLARDFGSPVLDNAVASPPASGTAVSTTDASVADPPEFPGRDIASLGVSAFRPIVAAFGARSLSGHSERMTGARHDRSGLHQPAG